MIHTQKGITLLEVLAATVILTIVIIAFTNVTSYSFLSRAVSDNRSEALQLADQTINKVRSFYSNPGNRLTISDNSASNTNVPFVPSPVSGVVSISGKYSIKVQQSGILDKSNTAYDLSNVSPNRVSAQGIILFKNSSNAIVPRLVTVIVSWNG